MLKDYLLNKWLSEYLFGSLFDKQTHNHVSASFSSFSIYINLRICILRISLSVVCGPPLMIKLNFFLDYKMDAQLFFSKAVIAHIDLKVLVFISLLELMKLSCTSLGKLTFYYQKQKGILL